MESAKNAASEVIDLSQKVFCLPEVNFALHFTFSLQLFLQNPDFVQTMWEYRHRDPACKLFAKIFQYGGENNAKVLKYLSLLHKYLKLNDVYLDDYLSYTRRFVLSTFAYFKEKEIPVTDDLMLERTIVYQSPKECCGRMEMVVRTYLPDIRIHNFKADFQNVLYSEYFQPKIQKVRCPKKKCKKEILTKTKITNAPKYFYFRVMRKSRELEPFVKITPTFTMKENGLQHLYEIALLITHHGGARIWGEYFVYVKKDDKWFEIGKDFVMEKSSKFVESQLNKYIFRRPEMIVYRKIQTKNIKTGEVIVHPVTKVIFDLNRTVLSPGEEVNENSLEGIKKIEDLVNIHFTEIENDEDDENEINSNRVEKWISEIENSGKKNKTEEKKIKTEEKKSMNKNEEKKSGNETEKKESMNKTEEKESMNETENNISSESKDLLDKEENEFLNNFLEKIDGDETNDDDENLNDDDENLNDSDEDEESVKEETISRYNEPVIEEAGDKNEYGEIQWTKQEIEMMKKMGLL